MSILDDVRRKYKSAAAADDPYGSNDSATDERLNTSPPSIQKPNHGTDKTAISPFVSYVSTYLGDLNTSDPAIRGSLEVLETRSQGEVPSHYTAMTKCRRCGPVPIWEGVPAEVLGCPWCLNRREGWPMPGGDV